MNQSKYYTENFIIENLDFIKSMNFSCIYYIENTFNNKIYIWQTKSFSSRSANHRRDLVNNKHQNKHLQNAFNLKNKLIKR